MLFKKKKFHRSRYLHSLKVTPKKIFINYKGKKYNFWVIKSGIHHLIQVIKVIANANGTNPKFALTNRIL